MYAIHPFTVSLSLSQQGFKQAKETRAVLVKKGYIEEVLLKDVASEYANDPSLANLISVRLLKPYKDDALTVEGECVDEEEDGETGEWGKFHIPLSLHVHVHCTCM